MAKRSYSEFPLGAENAHGMAVCKPSEEPATKKQRAGKWSAEEEAYSSLLIAYFQAGVLEDCEDGLSLRTYLSTKLSCSKMRISKKFAGKSIGKEAFTRCVGDAAVSSPTDAARRSPSTNRGISGNPMICYDHELLLEMKKRFENALTNKGSDMNRGRTLSIFDRSNQSTPVPAGGGVYCEEESKHTHNIQEKWPRMFYNLNGEEEYVGICEGMGDMESGGDFSGMSSGISGMELDISVCDHNFIEVTSTESRYLDIVSQELSPPSVCTGVISPLTVRSTTPSTPSHCQLHNQNQMPVQGQTVVGDQVDRVSENLYGSDPHDEATACINKETTRGIALPPTAGKHCLHRPTTGDPRFIYRNSLSRPESRVVTPNLQVINPRVQHAAGVNTIEESGEGLAMFSDGYLSRTSFCQDTSLLTVSSGAVNSSQISQSFVAANEDYDQNVMLSGNNIAKLQFEPIPGHGLCCALGSHVDDMEDEWVWKDILVSLESDHPAEDLSDMTFCPDNFTESYMRQIQLP